MIGMSGIVKLGIQVYVIKVDISNSWLVLDTTRLIHAIALIHNWHLLVLHDVLGQSASLVTENVVNHAKLFVEVGRLGFRREIPLFVIDFYIHRDKLCLDHIDHLNGNEQRNRYEIHNRDEPNSNIVEALADHIRFIVRLVRVQIPGRAAIVLGPHCQDNRADKRERKLDDHCSCDEVVQHLLVFGAFDSSIWTILHDFRIVTSEDAES